MKLNKKEIYFLALVSTILIIVTSLPIIYGYLISGNSYYNGLHIFSPLDGSVYYSYIQQVKEGKILLDDLFTNEPGGLKLFNVFWLVVGLIARILQLSPPLAYHLCRLILIPVFLICLYKFISYVLDNASFCRKKICCLYSIFATGVGGLSILLFGNRFFNNNPLDLQVPESSSFLTLFYSPHFIASLTLIILIFYFFLRALEKNRFILSVLAGSLALILFNFHPFFVPLIDGLPFFYLLILFIREKKFEISKLGHYLLLVSISFPSVAYYFYLLATNAALRNKAVQNNCLMPGGLVFFISYGFGLLLAILACIYLADKRKLNHKNLFLIIWFCLGIFFVYGPFNFQRRLTEGLQIPLTILAFIALAAFYDFLKTRWPALNKIKFNKISLKVIVLFDVVVILMVLLCFSNVMVYTWDFKYLKLKPPVIFINSQVKQALAWYRSKTDLSQTLLSARLVGDFTPGLVGRRVFWGHDVETVNFQTKKDQVEWFWRDNNDDLLKKEFLKSQRISFVFYSSEEKSMGFFDPSQKNYLTEVYKNNEAAIYKVISN